MKSFRDSAPDRKYRITAALLAAFAAVCALTAKGELPDDLRGETARLLRNGPYADLRNKAMIAFPAPGKTGRRG